MGFIQIPTTLLAMVDSSIGGKVAVDMPQGKNLVGAFYQPDAVFTDPDLLSSLSDAQYADGMAELLKHGFIRDYDLYNTLISSKHALRGKIPPGRLDQIISLSCSIKRDVVEEDEKDNGIRQLLNFGHTIGHAIERVQNYSGYSHGEAVSIGMTVMTRLTEKLGLTRKGESKKLAEALSLYGLPVEMPQLDTAQLVSAIRLDKKTRSGRITIAYIEEIGKGKLLELDIIELEEQLWHLYESFPDH
jgi:3-dehydroquinate synthase